MVIRFIHIFFSSLNGMEYNMVTEVWRPRSSCQQNYHYIKRRVYLRAQMIAYHVLNYNYRCENSWGREVGAGWLVMYSHPFIWGKDATTATVDVQRWHRKLAAMALIVIAVVHICSLSGGLCCCWKALRIASSQVGFCLSIVRCFLMPVTTKCDEIYTVRVPPSPKTKMSTWIYLVKCDILPQELFTASISMLYTCYLFYFYVLHKMQNLRELNQMGTLIVK